MMPLTATTDATNTQGDIVLLEKAVTASEDAKYRLMEELCQPELQAIEDKLKYLENLYDMLPGDTMEINEIVLAVIAKIVDNGTT